MNINERSTMHFPMPADKDPAGQLRTIHLQGAFKQGYAECIGDILTLLPPAIKVVDFKDAVAAAEALGFNDALSQFLINLNAHQKTLMAGVR